MKPRTCYVWVFISNDKGETNRYGARPLAAAELGASVAAVRLTNFQKNPSPVYIVRLAADGQTSCDCPQHNRTGKCKHSDALVAAGLLPAALVGMLQEQKRLLDGAEHDFACRDETVKNLIASVSNLKEKNDLLQKLLDEAQDFLMDMERPRRRPAARKAA